MTDSVYTHQKDKLTKWLVAVTLLLTIFTISGYARNYQQTQHHVTQTELVVSNKFRTAKQTISYKMALLAIKDIDFIIRPFTSWINTLFTYNLLTKVKFDHSTRDFSSHSSLKSHLQERTIPTSADEDISVIFIG